jgi:hypothetical protein
VALLRERERGVAADAGGRAGDEDDELLLHENLPDDVVCE